MDPHVVLLHFPLCARETLEKLQITLLGIEAMDLMLPLELLACRSQLLQVG